MKHKILLGSPLILALLLLLGSTALATTTWYVNGVIGNDNNNCLSPKPLARPSVMLPSLLRRAIPLR